MAENLLKKLNFVVFLELIFSKSDRRVFPNKDFSVCNVLIHKNLFLTTKLILQATEYVTVLLLYMWAKYEPIWLNFTGKTVIFSAH